MDCWAPKIADIISFPVPKYFTHSWEQYHDMTLPACPVPKSARLAVEGTAQPPRARRCCGLLGGAGLTGCRVTVGASPLSLCGLQGQSSGGTLGSPSLGRVTLMDHRDFDPVCSQPLGLVLQRALNSCTGEQGLSFGFRCVAAVCLAVEGENVGIRSRKLTLGLKHFFTQGAGFREVSPVWS